MKKIAFVFLAFLIVGCSKRERTGIDLNERNFDESLVCTHNCVNEAMTDDIHLFNENIHKVIENKVSNLCDSVLGKGFLKESELADFMRTIESNLSRYVQPNREITIDSLKINDLIEGSSSGRLKWDRNNLRNSNPLNIRLENLLAHEMTVIDLKIGGWNLNFQFNICLVEHFKELGTYTKTHLKNNTGLPFHRFQGKHMINIVLEVGDPQKGNNGQKEYYETNIIRQGDYYVSGFHKKHRIN